MKETISIKLFRTLQKGKEQLSKEAVEQISGFVKSQRTEEESFMDKSGKADLYYTLFGWILSYILGIRMNAQKTGLYLEKQRTDLLDLIHYAAYMRCRMIRQLSDGGKISLLFKSLFSTEIRDLHDFKSLPHNDPHSPYTQFIWLSLLEDTGNLFRIQDSTFNTQHSQSRIRDLVRTDRKEILSSLENYHAEGGGYMNTTDGLTATTNATVAALAVKGQLEGYKKNTDIDFLRDLQESSGGFKAAKVSPLPDLLSTATSLFMLKCYGIKPAYPARDFIEAHWLDSGGFSATLLDDKSDVEYTFYGLLALGAIGPTNPPPKGQGC